MRQALVVLLLCGISPIPASATMVIFQWTPTQILLATDSLSAKIKGTGEINGVTTCKIHQAGDAFFTIVGISDDPGTNVDLVKLASQATVFQKDIFGIVHTFEAIALPQVKKLWSFMAKRNPVAAGLATEAEGRMRITVIFASRKDHAVAMKDYFGDRSGNVTEDKPKFYGSAEGMARDTTMYAVGVYAEAANASANDPKIGKLEGVPYVNALFGIQIAHEKERLRGGQIPRIGTPVCILQIAHRTAQWISGQQGNCPQIAQ